MAERFNLPALFLGVSFLAVLGAITHLGMIITATWLLIFLPILLGAFYSSQLYRLATVWTPRSVFKNSLLVVGGGFVIMFLFMLSCHYFPELYPANTDRNEDITFGPMIYIGAILFAVLPIILYSAFAIWLPTGLASGESNGVTAIVHGGFWGLLLFVVCLALEYATNSLFGGVREDMVRGHTILFWVNIVIGIGSFMVSNYHDI
jgi:hypothetical protein